MSGTSPPSSLVMISLSMPSTFFQLTVMPAAAAFAFTSA